MARDYLTLEQLLLTPPGPALVALALVAGVGDLSWRAAGRLRLTGPIDALLTAVALIAILCAALHALVVIGAANLDVLRVGGALLIACGVRRLLQSGRDIVHLLIDLVRAEWRTSGWLGRALLANATCVLGALYLTAFAPATDADSLDYHLGVPLDWLRHGRAVPREDWLTARLAGIGESFSMLGLACGTDAAWAVLQATVFVAFVLALGSLENSPRRRRLIVTAAVVAPVLLFLVPSQKPLLLPAVATTLVVSAGADSGSWRWPHLAVVGVCLAFAAACKHSFLFGALVGMTLTLFRARRIIPIVASCGVAFVVIVAPLYAKNLIFYGDPLSPLLERFRPAASAPVVAFAQYLRDSGLPLDWPNIARVLVPRHAGDVSSVLGLGILTFAAVRPLPSARPVLLSAGLLVGLIGAAGQFNGRFLFEPYLWALCGLAGGTLRRGSVLAEGSLVVQGTVVAVAALILAANLSAGALTADWRETVMMRNAFGYLEAQWLEQLPTHAVVATGNRSRALLPRAFFVAEAPEARFHPAEFGLEVSLGAHRVSALVLPTDARAWSRGYSEYLERICAQRNGPPRRFPVASRNPFNRREGQSVQLYVAGRCPIP